MVSFSLLKELKLSYHMKIIKLLKEFMDYINIKLIIWAWIFKAIKFMFKNVM